MNRCSMLLTVVLLSAIAIPVRATTLYDSGTTSQTPPVAGVAMSGGVVDANSFVLSNAANLWSVSFYILECCTLEWSGAINYYLFTNNSFEPSSSPFSQGTITTYNRNAVYSDSATNVVTEIDFNLTNAVALSANTTYWLGIGLSAGGSGPTWNEVVSGSGLSATSSAGNFGSWGLQAQKGAFALFDTTFAAPEPNSAWLFLGGLGIAGFAYRRRKRPLRRS